MNTDKATRQHKKYERLLEYKHELQELEDDFTINRKRLQKLVSKVRSIGQKIGQKKQNILDGIN